MFCVTEPNSLEPLYEVALTLKVNPNSLTENMSKSKTVTPSYGGFVEFIWHDDLTSVSATQSTGGFLSPTLGMTSAQEGLNPDAGSQQQTVAYERYLDFLELFRMNGMVFDGNGLPAIRGKVMMIYDRGVFYGHFSTFEVVEEDEQPFTFDLSWDFKIEKAIYRFNQQG
jgi:hypothetical protein